MGFLSRLLGKDQADASLQASGIEEGKDKKAIADLLASGDDFRDRTQVISEIFNKSGGGGEAFEKVAEILGLRGTESRDAAIAEFRATPGFKFALEEGEKAVQRAAEAGGRGAEGRTLKEAARFTTGLTDQTSQQFINNLFGLGEAQSGREAQRADVLLRGETGRLNVRESAFSKRLAKPSATAQGLVAAETAKSAGAQNVLNTGATFLGKAAAAIATGGAG